MERRLQQVLDNCGENYILPFFWQHGESKELLEEGMEKIHASGIGAVCVESRPHPDFLGEKWWRDMDVIMAKAKQLGMRVWVLDDAHFPSGYCNGKVTENVLYGKTYLTHYTIDVVGPIKGYAFMVKLEADEKLVGVTLSKRDSQESFHQTKGKDVTNLVEEGKIYLDIPEGIWAVTVMKTTLKGTGRKGYINPINREAVRFFIDTVYEAHFKRYAEDFGGTFAGFFSDEPEIGNCFGEYVHDSYIGQPTMSLPWDRELETDLRKLWGEEFVTNLLAMWVNVDEYENPMEQSGEDFAQGYARQRYLRKGFSDNRPEWAHVPKGWTEKGQLEREPVTNRTGLLRRQFMGLVSDLYGTNFCTQIGDWCRAHGVEYIGHVIEDGGTHAHLGLGTGHFFKALWGQDMSGIDVVLQQIRPRLDDLAFYSVGGKGFYHGEFFHYGLGKLGASLAHLDAKKKGRTMCEVFGAYGWAEGLKLMKWIVDHMLVRGINYFVPHAFTMKDFPDPDCPPHFYARGRNPQYPWFRYLMEYTNRVSHLISGGLHKPVVGLLYTAEQEWMGAVRKFEKDAKILLRGQIDFEVVSEEILADARLEEGRLILGQESVKALIVPGSEYLSRQLLDKCRTLTEKGFPVLFTEQIPRGLEENGRFKQENMQAEAPGKLVRGERLAEELRNQGIYDVKTSRYQPWLRYYRYEQTEGEFWLFFTECVTEDLSTDLFFTGGLSTTKQEDMEWIREWWYDPWTNRLEPCVRESDGRMKLALSPYEMKILYREKVKKENAEEMRMPSVKQIVSSQELMIPEWEVCLCPSEKLPQGDYLENETLWETFEGPLGDVCAIDRKPYFSGLMRYRGTFVLDKLNQREYMLDLGEAYETVELKINGKKAGVRIAPPYRYEITEYLKEGENQLEILVANTLAHQLRDGMSMTLPMEPAGLIGPLKLIQRG